MLKKQQVETNAEKNEEPHNEEYLISGTFHMMVLFFITHMDPVTYLSK